MLSATLSSWTRGGALNNRGRRGKGTERVFNMTLGCVWVKLRQKARLALGRVRGRGTDLALCWWTAVPAVLCCAVGYYQAGTVVQPTPFIFWGVPYASCVSKHHLRLQGVFKQADRETLPPALNCPNCASNWVGASRVAARARTIYYYAHCDLVCRVCICQRKLCAVTVADRDLQATAATRSHLCLGARASNSHCTALSLARA